MTHYARRIITVLLVILTTANICVFLVRDSSWYHAETSYSTIYYPLEQQRIERFKITRPGAVQVFINEPPTGDWEITAEGDESYTSPTPPELNLQTQPHRYSLRKAGSRDKPPIVLEIDHLRGDAYHASGQSTGDQYHLISSSVPAGRFPQYPIDTFTKGYLAYDQAELVGAKIELKRVGIEDIESTHSKIEKIGAFILSRLDDRRGIPNDGMQQATPYQMYQRACRGEGSVWCSNFAWIFAFFANVAGIPTRIVTLGGSLDGVGLSGHGLCECYMAEQQGWAYVDPTSRILGVQNTDGRALNTVELFHALATGTSPSLTATLWKAGATKRVPFDREMSRAAAYYLSPNATIDFAIPHKPNTSLTTRVKRYVTSQQFTYSRYPRSNFKYYLKIGLLALQIVVIAAFAALGLRHWYRSYVNGTQ